MLSGLLKLKSSNQKLDSVLIKTQRTGGIDLPLFNPFDTYLLKVVLLGVVPKRSVGYFQELRSMGPPAIGLPESCQKVAPLCFRHFFLKVEAFHGKQQRAGIAAGQGRRCGVSRNSVWQHA